VVIPRLLGRGVVEGFIHDSAEWILRKHLDARERAGRADAIVAQPLVTGARLPYLGVALTLELRHRCRFGSVELGGDRLTVKLGSVPPGTELQSAIRRLLIEWYHARAQQAVRRSVERQQRITALRPAGLRIRDQRSRWGSCGVGGVLNINWRLILAPPAVLDYVVLHELCHLRHRNHSRCFWSLVAQQMPDYDRHRSWLREHGTELMSFLGNRSPTRC
jgi:hypothetical protein